MRAVALMLLTALLGGCVSDPERETSWCGMARAFEGYQASPVQSQAAQARRDNQVEAARPAACQWVDG